jgi:hypothetical protein
VAEGAAVASRRRAPARRWLAVAAAIRGWALAHPHEYALLYGSPVPGYHAPTATTASGTRPSLALLSVVRDAAAAGDLSPTPTPQVPPALARDLTVLRREISLEVDDDVLVAALVAWTQLFGLVSFEVFGQTRGLVDDHDALFTAMTSQMATSIGLRDGVARSTPG